MQLNTLKDFEYVTQPDDKKNIGEGAFSSVRLVRLLSNNKLYAMKEIDLTVINKDHIGNLKEEIKIHQSLKHPNIIRFEDCFQDGTMVYIQLEYAENGSLFFFIDPDNGLDEKLAFKFFYQTSMAFEYIHSKGIMHRDLKPENILLTKNFDIKLCDFGWAKTFKESKEDNVICGTFEYMPPEIVFEQPHTYKVDVWALGILLYELLHGKPPFKANSLDEIRECFRQQTELHFEKHTSAEARSLLIQLLQIDPEKRISLEKVFYHPFFQKHINAYENNMYNEVPSPQKSTQSLKQKRKATNHSQMSSSINQSISETQDFDQDCVINSEWVNFKKKTVVTDMSEVEKKVEEKAPPVDIKESEREIIRKAIQERNIDPNTIRSASLVYTVDNKCQVKLKLIDADVSADQINISGQNSKRKLDDVKKTPKTTQQIIQQQSQNVNQIYSNNIPFDNSVSPIETRRISEGPHSPKSKNPLLHRISQNVSKQNSNYKTVSQNMISAETKKNHETNFQVTSPNFGTQEKNINYASFNTENNNKDSFTQDNNQVSVFSSSKDNIKIHEQKSNFDMSEPQSEQSTSEQRSKYRQPNRRVISQIEGNGKTTVKFPEMVERRVYYQKASDIQDRSRSRSLSEQNLDVKKENTNVVRKTPETITESSIKQETKTIDNKYNKTKKLEIKIGAAEPIKQNVTKLLKTPNDNIPDKPDSLTTHQANFNFPINHHQPEPLNNAKTVNLGTSSNQLFITELNKDYGKVRKYQNLEDFEKKIGYEDRKVLKINTLKKDYNDKEDPVTMNLDNINNFQREKSLSNSPKGNSKYRSKSPMPTNNESNQKFIGDKKVIDQESANILKLKENLNSFNNKLIKQNEIITEYESKLTKISEDDKTHFNNSSMEIIYANVETTNPNYANSNQNSVRNDSNTQIQKNSPISNNNLLKDISATIEKSQNYREKYKERQVNLTPREKEIKLSEYNHTQSEVVMNTTSDNRSNNPIRRKIVNTTDLDNKVLFGSRNYEDNSNDYIHANTESTMKRISHNSSSNAISNRVENSKEDHILFNETYDQRSNEKQIKSNYITTRGGRVLEKKTMNNRYEENNYNKDYDNQINDNKSIERKNNIINVDKKVSDNKERMVNYAKGHIDVKENFEIEDKKKHQMTAEMYKNARDVDPNDLIYKKYPELFLKHFKTDLASTDGFNTEDQRKRHSEKPSEYYSKNNHTEIRRKSTDYKGNDNKKIGNNELTKKHLNQNNPLYARYMSNQRSGENISSTLVSKVDKSDTAGKYELPSDLKDNDDYEKRFYRRQANYIADNEKNSSGGGLRLYRSKSPINTNTAEHANYRAVTSISKEKSYLRKDENISIYENFKKGGKEDGKIVYSRKVTSKVPFEDDDIKIKDNEFMKNAKQREIYSQNKHIQTEKKTKNEPTSKLFSNKLDTVETSKSNSAIKNRINLRENENLAKRNLTSISELEEKRRVHIYNKDGITRSREGSMELRKSNENFYSSNINRRVVTNSIDISSNRRNNSKPPIRDTSTERQVKTVASRYPPDLNNSPEKNFYMSFDPNSSFEETNVYQNRSDNRLVGKVQADNIRRIGERHGSKENVIYESPAELLNEEIKIGQASPTFLTKETYENGQLNIEKKMIKDIKARYTKQNEKKMDAPQTNILDTSLDIIKKQIIPINAKSLQNASSKPEYDIGKRRIINRSYLEISGDNVLKSNLNSYEDLNLLDHDEKKYSEKIRNSKKYIKIKNSNEGNHLHETDLNNRSVDYDDKYGKTSDELRFSHKQFSSYFNSKYKNVGSSIAGDDVLKKLNNDRLSHLKKDYEKDSNTLTKSAAYNYGETLQKSRVHENQNISNPLQKNTSKQEYEPYRIVKPETTSKRVYNRVNLEQSPGKNDYDYAKGSFMKEESVGVPIRESVGTIHREAYYTRKVVTDSKKPETQTATSVRLGAMPEPEVRTSVRRYTHETDIKPSGNETVVSRIRGSDYVPQRKVIDKIQTTNSYPSHTTSNISTPTNATSEVKNRRSNYNPTILSSYDNRYQKETVTINRNNEKDVYRNYSDSYGKNSYLGVSSSTHNDKKVPSRGLENYNGKTSSDNIRQMW